MLCWAHSYNNLGIWDHCTVYTECTQMLKVLPGIKSYWLNPRFNHRTIKKPFTSKQICWSMFHLKISRWKPRIWRLLTPWWQLQHILLLVTTVTWHDAKTTGTHWLLLQLYFSCWWGSSGTVAGKEKWLVTIGLLLTMSEPITAQRQPGGPFYSIWKEHYLGLTTSK